MADHSPPYKRIIQKPVAETVRVALGGTELPDNEFTIANDTGVISFRRAVPQGVRVTAGFAFDVPVRFDTDYLEIDYSAFAAGEIPKIPLIEILL